MIVPPTPTATGTLSTPPSTSTPTPSACPIQPGAISLGSGPAGSQITVPSEAAYGGTWQATWWFPSCGTDFVMAGNGYAGTCAAPPGSYPIVCDVPSDAAPGAYNIRNETNNGNQGQDFYFMVTGSATPTPGEPSATATSTATPTAPPTVTITATPVAQLGVHPTSGTVGQTLTFTGTGFSPGEPVTISVDTLTAPALVFTIASASGSLSITHGVPALTYGPHTFLAQGLSNQRVATTAFTMLPLLRLQPNSGTAKLGHNCYNLRLWGEGDGAAVLGQPHRHRAL